MPGPHRCIRLMTTAYISHVVSITTHTHDRRKSIGKKKQRTNKKRKERNFGGLRASLPPERDVTWFSTVYSSTTNDFRYTRRSTDYRPLRDRQLAVVVTCLCVGGPCALPLVCSCLSQTCGVLDGLTAAARQNVHSYDV